MATTTTEAPVEERFILATYPATESQRAIRVTKAMRDWHVSQARAKVSPTIPMGWVASSTGALIEEV